MKLLATLLVVPFLGGMFVACVGDSSVPSTNVDSGGVDSSQGKDSGGDTSSPTDTGPGADVGCGAQTLCGGKCIDTMSDKDNCGACAHICPGTMCSNGDCIKRVFVSSVATGSSASGDAKNYDVQCQNLATQVPLDGKYKAWVSDDSSSPSTRFTHSKAAYQRMDGMKIAADWTGLTSGTLSVAINRDEKNQPASGQVWSDTAVDGTEIPAMSNGANCGNWAGVGNFGAYGDITATDATWTNKSYGTCNTQHRIYCFEQ